jgi:hypothetical protein
MRKVVFTSTAWGELYLKNYFDYILPNHLACLKKIEDADYEYCFYTSTADFDKVNNILGGISKFKVLSRNIGGRYDQQVVHSEALRTAGVEGTDASILQADSLYPINMLYNLLNLANSTGKKVFFAPAYRVTYNIKSYLKDCDYSAGSLVKLSLRHLHPRFIRHCMDDDIYTNYIVTTKGYIPSQFYWKFKDSGFIMRATQMHPIYFTRIPVVRSDVALDHGLYLSEQFSKDDYYVITDSDVAMIIDVDTTIPEPLPPIGTIVQIDSGNQIHPKPGTNLTKAEIKEWAIKWALKHMHENLKNNLYIHGDSLNEEWESLKEKVASFMIETYGDLLG